MWRYVNYNGLDRYCRYLNVGLYRVDDPISMTICQGTFGQFLKDRLRIQRMPCGFSMVEMIVKGALLPDLFVRFPSESLLSKNRRIPRDKVRKMATIGDFGRV